MNRKLDTDTHVYFYEQEFYVLSNFSSFRVYIDGIDFDTAEHAYHWYKFLSPSLVKLDILRARSAHQAFKIARENASKVRPDWDSIKIPIMRNILRTKYEQHEYVRRKLHETGNRILVEDSWRDDFWGIGENKDGKNMLGRLWMEIRDNG